MRETVGFTESQWFEYFLNQLDSTFPFELNTKAKKSSAVGFKEVLILNKRKLKKLMKSERNLRKKL